MYSIILLRVNDRAFFKQYQFVFQSAKVKEELEICYWDASGENSDNNGVDVVIRELNTRLRDYSEWKLIIYDENCENAVPDEIMGNFIELLTQTGTLNRHRQLAEVAFPVQLFYVCMEEKIYIPFGTEAVFCHIDREKRFGRNFRMLRFEMETENNGLQSNSELKLCCILLSLALGQIPYTFMDAGYLYNIDIEIDQEQFSQYIMMLGERLDRIKERCERERENLKKQLRTVTPFPDATIPEIHIEEGYKNRKEFEEKHKVMTFREMLKNSDVEWVLRQNRELIERQMFYPKGVLHEESIRIRKRVEELKGTENFLDEAGKELLNRKISDLFNEMCEKKDIQLKQQEFEEAIIKTEKMIKNQSARIMKKKERRKILFIGALGECAVLEAYAINMSYSYNLGERSWIPILVAGLLGFSIVYIGYYFYLLLCHKVECWGEWNKLVARLRDYQREKKQYLESILNIILRYQYLEKIIMEQDQLRQQWDRDCRMLENHECMLNNGFAGLRPLMCLGGEREKRKSIFSETLKMDFTKMPKEEDYYGISFQKKNNQMEINYSGYKTNTAFKFVTRLIIKKAICNEEGE